MAIALFVCLLIAFLFIFVPRDEYEVTPGAAAVDVIKRQFSSWLLSREDILKMLGRSMKDMVKTGLLVGMGLAVLIFLITFRLLGPFAVVLSLAGLILGMLLAEKLLDKEYKRWQEDLLSGVPQMVNFVPAFLEIEGVLPREALNYTLPFLPEPLKSEMWSVINKVKRTGKVHEAMDAFSKKANHPLIDAICFRLSAAWDAKVTSDLFADLSDQVEDMTEMAVARATTAKTGYMALVCVLGLLGMVLIYGYPGGKYLLDKITGGFI